MARAVGIDLGTTNSLVGATSRNRDLLVLDPSSNREWVPSLVGLDPSGGWVVGHAVEALVEAGQSTAIHSVKRLMGRTWDDPHVQRLITERRLFYDVIEHPQRPGEIAIRIGSHVLTPVDVSAMILRHLRTTAESHLGDTVGHAVITVPAYFRDPAILATRDAGRIAGLRVKHVMPEPTAAAMAYGAHELSGGSVRYTLVYDFGGGTFDVSVLTAVGGDLAVMGVGGDNFLGGDDVDRAVMQRFDDQIRREHGVSLLDGTGLHAQDRANLRALQWRLKLAAREAKEGLAAAPSRTVIRPALFQALDGSLVNAVWTLTRAELESLARPFVDRTLESVLAAVGQSGLAPADLEQIVVAGGSSRLPGVVERLREMFPAGQILFEQNPMTAIAIGATRTSRAPMPWACPSCQRANDLTSDRCVGCSTPAPREDHPCGTCGALMNVTQSTCPNPRCGSGVSLPSVPIEKLSHAILVQIAGDTDEAWHELVGRDADVAVLGTEPSPWQALTTNRADQGRIELPIAQAADDSGEEPGVIATFATYDTPADLAKGERVEVRVRLDSDRIALAEVRVRGRIHATRRLTADEIAASRAAADAGRDWQADAETFLFNMQLAEEGIAHLPKQSRDSANAAALAGYADAVARCRRAAAAVGAARERGDRKAAEAEFEAARRGLLGDSWLPREVGFAMHLRRRTLDADERQNLARAVSQVTWELEHGDPERVRAAAMNLEGTTEQVAGPGSSREIRGISPSDLLARG